MVLLHSSLNVFASVSGREIATGPWVTGPTFTPLLLRSNTKDLMLLNSPSTMA